MNWANLIKDPYNRRSRLQPALLSLLPIFVLIPLLYPGVEARATGLLTLAAYLGGAMWLTQIWRERGKRLAATLFARWGGKPSVAFLRHRDTNLAETTQRRYLSFISRRVHHFRAPSANDERNDPAKADDMYQAATDWLLARTRDQKKRAQHDQFTARCAPATGHANCSKGFGSVWVTDDSEVDNAILPGSNP